MSAVTYYVMQPFVLIKKGRVRPGQPQPMPSAEAAKKAAARAAARGGAVAFARTGDPEIGDFDDADILAVFGEVPNAIAGAIERHESDDLGEQ